MPNQPERFKRKAGREVWVSLHNQPAPFIRSDQQNKYLWGVVYAYISAETGNDPETIHYALKREAVRTGILDPEYVLLWDRLVEAEPTTKVDSEQFSRYVTWVRHEAEHGNLTGQPLHIPEAGE